MTYITEIHEDLPHASFVEPRVFAAKLSQEEGEITQLAEFCLNVERLILFPAVDIRKNVRMLTA